MKIKLTPGTEYIFNSIVTYPSDKEIDLTEFVSDIMANRFYSDFIIGYKMWIDLIKNHNEKV